MRIALLFSFMILLQSALIAQGPDINWQITLGGTQDDESVDIIETPDGGFIMAGTVYSTDGNVTGHHGYYDIWAVKLNQHGTFQWQKCYGGSSEDRAKDIINTSDGGFLICGETYSMDGDISTQHGEGDIWLIKCDADGNIEWEKSVGGGQPDRANSIVQLADGTFLITGTSSSFSGDFTGPVGDKHFMVARLNQVGNMVWSKRLGGSAYEEGFSIIQAANGDILMTGYCKSTDGDVTGGGFGDGDVWVVRTNIFGTILWNKVYGGNYWDWTETILETADGDIIVSGYSGSTTGHPTGNHGEGDMWVVKMNSTGDLLWENCLGGSRNDFSYDMVLTADEGVLLCGNTWSPNDGDVSGNHAHVDAWLVQLDSSGNLLWQKCYGGNSGDFFYGMHTTSDGGHILTGETYSWTDDIIWNHGKKDIWVVKVGGIVGISEQTALGSLNMYPNPVQDNTTITFDAAGSLAVEIYDLGGRLKMKSTVNSTESIDLSDLSAGTYICKVDGYTPIRFIKH